MYLRSYYDIHCPPDLGSEIESFVMPRTPFRTIRVWAGAIAFAASLWLIGCGDKTPQQTATLTFKRDGSHFTGAVIRKDPDSITLTGPNGDSHTFLNAELSNIQFASAEPPPGNAGAPPPVPEQPPAQSAASPLTNSPAAAANTLPAGTEFRLRSQGFLDSCCVPVGALATGTADSDVKSAGGQIAIPAGANMLFELKDTKMVDGRVTMTFDLVSADFGGHHYRIISAEGELAVGAQLVVAGAKENSQESKERGMNVHLDAGAIVVFKAVTPVAVRPRA
jgi:hypothetical protein